MHHRFIDRRTEGAQTPKEESHNPEEIRMRRLSRSVIDVETYNRIKIDENSYRWDI